MFKFKASSYVNYNGDRYLIIDRKIEATKKLYRLMGYFDWVQEKELTRV